MLRRSLILLCAAVSAGGWSPAAAGATSRASVPGTKAPHLLPARGVAAAAAQSRTWIVGARPTASSGALARRSGAHMLSRRGIFVVPRERVRDFVAALRHVGAYTFSEPNRRVRAAQVPPAPIDDFAATDWRGYLVPQGLVPPPVDGAPLSAIVDSAPDVTQPDLAGVQVTGNPAVVDEHGTAVASVLAGRANGVGMVGMYPGAPVLAVGSALDTASITRAIAT